MRIFEQTLRDGLGAYPPVPADVKAQLAERLIACKIDYLEVVRFPETDDYPQFREPRKILEGVQRYRNNATVAVFAMGHQGIDEAVRYSDYFDEMHIPVFASDAYGRFALGEDWKAALSRVAHAIRACAGAHIKLTIGLGTCYGCPLDPKHSHTMTASRVRDLVERGVDTVMLGDTAGQAAPRIVREVLDDVADAARPKTLRIHFHDTFGRALLNTWTAVSEYEVDGVDTSLLGLGGEPYPYFRAPELVNNGNCATEALVALMESQGIDVGECSYAALSEVARWLYPHVQGTVFGRAGFSDLVPLPDEEAPGEVSQVTHRH